MAKAFQSSEHPQLFERRIHRRQKLLFSRVELGPDNHGVVLNISPTGLALQAAEELTDDELPKIRFQFSQSEAWIEAKGRIAWKSDSKKVAGVEFLDLPMETRKQIQILIFLNDENGFSKREVSPKTEPFSSEIPASESPGAIPFPESTVVELVLEDRSEASIFPSVRAFTETQGAAAISEIVARNAIPDSQIETVPEEPSNASTCPLSESSTETQTDAPILPLLEPMRETKTDETASEHTITTVIKRFSEHPTRVVGSTLVVMLLLFAVIPLRHYLQKTATAQKAPETTTELNLPVLSSQNVSEPSLKSSANLASNARPASERAVSNSRPRPSVDRTAFVLQVAAMAHEENANALAESLRKLNFPAFVLKSPTARFHRVIVGPYNGADAAQKAKQELEKRGFRTIRSDWNKQAR